MRIATLAAGSVALLLIAAAGYLLVPAEVGSNWPEESFSSDAWKAQPYNLRYRFVRDLIRSRTLMGKSTSQVEEALGEVAPEI